MHGSCMAKLVGMHSFGNVRTNFTCRSSIIFHKNLHSIPRHRMALPVGSCIEQIIIHSASIIWMKKLQIPLQMVNCYFHQWDRACLVSFSSKVYKRSISVQKKVLEPNVQQLLASCSGVVHQTHKTLISNSCSVTGIRLHKQGFQSFLT